MKKVHRIISIPEGMTWKEFAVQYDKFFPISDDAARREKLRYEYYRLTGKIAKDEEPSEPVKRKKNVITQEVHSQNSENNDRGTGTDVPSDHSQ
jgi:hypothetical protein